MLLEDPTTKWSSSSGISASSSFGVLVHSVPNVELPTAMQSFGLHFVNFAVACGAGNDGGRRGEDIFFSRCDGNNQTASDVMIVFGLREVKVKRVLRTGRCWFEGVTPRQHLFLVRPKYRNTIIWRPNSARCRCRRNYDNDYEESATGETHLSDYTPAVCTLFPVVHGTWLEARAWGCFGWPSFLQVTANVDIYGDAVCTSRQR